MSMAAGCRLGFDESQSEIRDAQRDDAGASDDATDGNGGSDAGNDAAPVVCPGNYITLGVGTSVYRLETNSVPWLSAEQSCETDGQHLVVVDDVVFISGEVGVGGVVEASRDDPQLAPRRVGRGVT